MFAPGTSPLMHCQHGVRIDRLCAQCVEDAWCEIWSELGDLDDEAEFVRLPPRAGQGNGA